MQLLKERICRDGKVSDGNILRVDSFLNHQIDVSLLCEIGKEFKRLFTDCDVNKILTVEASGIGIACITAQFFNVPVVFAKKNKTKNISCESYSSKVESYTHGKSYDIVVSRQYLGANDRVLIIDDFLAHGNALFGLVDLVKASGATLMGAGIVIEKGFQDGGAIARGQGIRVESLAIVESMSVENGVVFR